MEVQGHGEARRRLLTREALARQFDPPTDKREIVRHFNPDARDSRVGLNPTWPCIAAGLRHDAPLYAQARAGNHARCFACAHAQQHDVPPVFHPC